MKIIRNFMSILVLLIGLYSCEPEEMPNGISDVSATETDSGTDPGTPDNGDDEDETSGSHEG